MCSHYSFRGGFKERRLMICWSYSFGGGSKMERRLVMCSSYSFRGGSKRERRTFDVFECKLQRWIQGEEACNVFEL